MIRSNAPYKAVTVFLLFYFIVLALLPGVVASKLI